MHKGKKHDYAIFEEEFKDIDVSKYTICADSGFQGIKKSCANKENINIPYKKSKKNPLTDTQKEYNKNLSSKRVVVENSLASLKTFFILKNRQKTLDLENINDVVEICAGLSNFKNKMFFHQKGSVFF